MSKFVIARPSFDEALCTEFNAVQRDHGMRARGGWTTFHVGDVTGLTRKEFVRKLRMAMKSSKTRAQQGFFGTSANTLDGSLEWYVTVKDEDGIRGAAVLHLEGTARKAKIVLHYGG